MAMGAEPSVPMAQSTRQTTTRPARASTPDFAERIFSLMVLPAVACRIARRVAGVGGTAPASGPAFQRVQPPEGGCGQDWPPHSSTYSFFTLYAKLICTRISAPLNAGGSGGNGLAALMAAMAALSS